MAYCYFIHGQRGSGKGAFAVHRIRDVLSQGNKVATNMTLFLDNLMPYDDYSKVIRLPDIPNGEHLKSIGLAYDFDPNDPSTIDETQEGLLVLDEIKLYLTKSNKEFHEIVNFLVQSRKYGWNILLTGQHKDQAEDVVYKSLTDKLIVCRDETKFLGKLRFFHFLPFIGNDGHKAYIFDGRSELDEIETTIPYDYRPVKLAYSTAQIFERDDEYHNNQFIDMRSLYSYLPAAYLSKHHYIKQYQDKINEIKNIGVETMAISKAQNGMSTGQKVKIGLMLVGLAAYLYLSNPMENPILQKTLGTESPQLELSSVTPVQSQPYIPVIQSNNAVTSKPQQFDFIRTLFEDFRPRLSAYASSSNFGITLIVDFYKGSEIQERLVLDDFHINGYSVIPSGLNAVIIQSNVFKHRVTSWPLKEPVSQPAPDIVLTSN